jgi:hypothetical protein
MLLVLRLRFGVEGLRFVGLAPPRSRAVGLQAEKPVSRPSPCAESVPEPVAPVVEYDDGADGDTDSSRQSRDPWASWPARSPPHEQARCGPE